MAKNVKIIIMADVSDDPEIPDFKVVGGQRSASLSEENDPIDMTSEDSNGWEEYDYGITSWTISCDGVYVPTAEGYQALKNAMRERKKVLVRIQEDGQDTEEGLALVTSRELEGEYDGESTYSMELQGTGPLGEPSGGNNGGVEG